MSVISLNPVGDSLTTRLLNSGRETADGRLKGEPLSLVAVNSFADTSAAEELPAGNSERSEERRRTLKERGAQALPRKRLIELQQIDAVLQRMGIDPSGKEFEKVAERTVAASLGRRSVRSAVEEFSDDPTVQYALLLKLQQQVKGDGEAAASPARRAVPRPPAPPPLPPAPMRPDGQEAITDALLTLEMERGAAILAGLNTLESAQAYGPGLAAGSTFRAAYRDAVLGEASLIDTLKAVIGRFGEAGLQKGLALLLRALGEDLQSMRPSREPERLHLILADIQQLQSVGTVFADCRDLCKRMATLFALMLQPVPVLREMIGLTAEGAATPWAIDSLVNGWLRLKDHQCKQPRRPGLLDDEDDDAAAQAELDLPVHLLTALSGAVRGLPVKLFASAESRLMAIDAVQASLDQAIQRADS
jgi:hypothetical protein